MPQTDDEQKKEEKKKVIITATASFVVGSAFAYLLTSLILNKKYAKLEAQYWGM